MQYRGGLEILADSPMVFGAAHHEDFRSFRPDVAYSPVHDRYMVVWEQEANARDSWQIFARQLSGRGTIYRQHHVNTFKSGNGLSALRNRHPRVIASNDGRFIVVWQADLKSGRFTPLETEIFGRMFRATGDPSLYPFRISFAGLTGDTAARAETPEIAYNSKHDEFLVVWRANAPLLAEGNGVWEIYSIRLRASDAHRLGVANKLTTTSTAEAPATSPVVAYNAVDNNYFLVWQGTDGRAVSMAAGEKEIIGRPLDLNGKRTSVPGTRVSDMGAPRNRAFGSSQPDIAYNVRDNQYLVVWRGNNGIPNDFEIHGQFLNNIGRDVGSNFQISDMGVAGGIAHFFPARDPVVCYQEGRNEYLVVWAGTDSLPGMIVGEEEIFGRYLTESGLDRSEPFRMSDLGPDGNNRFDAANPAVTSNGSGEYLVAFDGNDDRSPLTEERTAIFGQRFDSVRPLEFLRITGIRLVEGVLEITFEATEGTPTQVQGSVDLENWSFVSNIVAAEGVTTYRDEDAFSENRARYYRIIVR